MLTRQKQRWDRLLKRVHANGKRLINSLFILHVLLSQVFQPASSTAAMPLKTTPVPAKAHGAMGRPSTMTLSSILEVPTPAASVQKPTKSQPAVSAAAFAVAQDEPEQSFVRPSAASKAPLSQRSAPQPLPTGKGLAIYESGEASFAAPTAATAQARPQDHTITKQLDFNASDLTSSTIAHERDESTAEYTGAFNRSNRQVGAWVPFLLEPSSLNG